MADDDAQPVRSTVDPRKPTIATVLGKKGSGKSVLARRLWETYPFDRLAIDPHNDLHAEDVKQLREPLPSRFPAPLTDAGEPVRASFRYVPDMGSKTHQDDMDRAVGVAMNNRGRRTLLWLDEVGDLTSASYTPPWMRRALHTSRHRDLSMVMCGPRAIDINPLVLSQADRVYIFDLPSVRDRERVAGTIGYPAKDFDAAVHGLGKFEFLMWDGDELVHFPPLPVTHRTLEEQEKRHAVDHDDV